MSRRFSKLKESLKRILRDGCELRLEVYRMKSQRGSTDMPVFTILKDKEKIWRYPDENSKAETHRFSFTNGTSVRKSVEYPYLYSMHKSTDRETVCDMIRVYVDTPRDELRNLEDPFGLFDALRQVDRRISQRAKTTPVHP